MKSLFFYVPQSELINTIKFQRTFYPKITVLANICQQGKVILIMIKISKLLFSSSIRTSWTIGKNTILKDDYCIKILKTIEEKTKKKIKNQYLIYCGTKDGLNGQTFWKCVDKLSNLLMIFKSKSGYIFGAFSPCQWQLMSGSYFQDNALSSFLFSQTHDQIYPLKEANKQHSIYCNQSSYGPTFGGGHDLYISADFNGGYSSLGHSYQCNQYQIANTSTHLFGQSTPNIAECEILMLTFG